MKSPRRAHAPSFARHATAARPCSLAGRLPAGLACICGTLFSVHSISIRGFVSSIMCECVLVSVCVVHVSQVHKREDSHRSSCRSNRYMGLSHAELELERSRQHAITSSFVVRHVTSCQTATLGLRREPVRSFRFSVTSHPRSVQAPKNTLTNSAQMRNAKSPFMVARLEWGEI